MRATVERHDDISILNLTGRLTAGEPAVLLRDRVGELLNHGARRIVLNLKSVPWVDSGGIGELVACQKRAARAGGEIRLINVHGRVYELLRLVRLVDYFQIYRKGTMVLGSF